MRAGRWMQGAVLLLSATAGVAQDESGIESARADDAARSAPMLDSIPVEPMRVEAPAEPASPSASAQLEEIVVTAQKRVESLQETPISIQAFNAEKLSLRGIEGLADLAVQAPGLTIEPFPTHNATLRLFIRGVGLGDAQLTQDPAVGVYLDGVYIARSVGLALDVADLQRIEVLRGPQGTLYGRNTTGGAINLVTRRPLTDAFTMEHKLTFGERGLLFGRSSFNVPVNDDLAFRLALLGSRKDGYVENTGPGGDFGDRQEFALRFDTRWTPTYWLTADYAYDRSDMDYHNYLFQAVQRPNADKGEAELFKGFAQTQSIYATNRLDRLSSGPPLEESGTQVDGHALTLTALLGTQELKYIGAYRELTDREYADLGGGAGSLRYRLDSHVYDGPAADRANGGPTPLVIPTVTQSQWSHELQLSGRLFDDSFKYIVGAFQFSEEATEDRHRLNHQFSTAIGPDAVTRLLAVLPANLGAQLLSLAAPRLVNLVDLRWDIENEARAYFAQGTWSPTFLDERLHLTVGYRRSEDERRTVKFRISDTYVEGDLLGSGVGTAFLLSSGEMFDDVAAARRFQDDSWAHIAAYDLTPSLHVYAKRVEAYKSGGFNVRDPNVSGTTDESGFGIGYVDGFEPEYVQSNEAGFKSEWFGRRLRFNANAFDADYTNMQINFLIPGTISDTKTRNAGKARLRGAEVETTWLVHENLILSGDYAYLDARVTDVRDADGNNVAHQFPFQSAPRHSWVLAADWTLWRAGWGELRAYTTYNHVDRRSGLNLPGREGLTFLPAYSLVNARIGAYGIRAGERGSLDIALWGRNLADEEYPIAAIDNLPHADRAVYWGEPRTLGLDLVYRFH
ncbi:MAG TPA: TonB-dependent receptor [Solimonas sp.]